MKETRHTRRPRTHGDDRIAPPLTPLIDIAFLVLIFFMALPLKRLDGKLDAHLPKHKGPSPIEDTEPPQQPVSFRIVPRADGVRYRIGEHTTTTAAGMRPVLQRLGPQTAFEVHGAPAVGWQEVLDAIDELARLRARDVQFRGARVPQDAHRSIPLPAPAER